MTQVVDGRNDQILEDSSFAQMLAEEPVDDGAVLEELEQPSEDAGSEEDEGKQATGNEASARRREGTDSVLKRLDQQDPEAARVLRGMQQNMGRMQNEWNDLRTQTIDTLLELERLRAGEGPSERASQSEELPEGMTPEHVETFRKIADHLGYVPREELESRAMEEAMDTHAAAAERRAIELYGDAFGTLSEDGSLQINPEVREELGAILDRLEDPAKGVTLLDLYQIRYGPLPARQAAAKATVQGPQQQQQQRPRSVARRSTGGGQQLRIYDPARGDTPDQVVDRAWALAKRELGF